MHPILLEAPFADALAKIDRALADPADLPALLEPIPLDVFGLLLLDVPDAYPNLQRHLPRMPPPALQEQWVGSSGEALLRESVAFVRSLTANYRALVGRPLAAARLLDYGCGWGRLLRLLYKYVPPSQVYGADSFAPILATAAELGIRSPLALVERHPTQAPFGEVRFDLIFAFSLLTNLSERSHRHVLDVWHRCLTDDGLVALTIRPRSFWHKVGHRDAARLLAEHDARGFAFQPLPGAAPVDGDLPYGDASIDMAYIRREWTGWSVVEIDYNAVDEQQIIVFLKKALPAV